MKTYKLIRYGTLCLALVLTGGMAHAASRYLKPNVSDWTNLANYWDVGTEPPTTNDVVWNCSTATNYVSYGTASWDIFQRVPRFAFERDDGTLIITVGEGVCATNVTLLGSSVNGEVFEKCGTIVKRGKGTLVYYSTSNVFHGASCNFLTKNLRIEEGELRLPQDVDVSYRLGNVYVAEGSTLSLARRAVDQTTSSSAATTYLASLSGSGLVTNTTSHGVPLVFERAFTNAFTGVMGGGIFLQLKADGIDFNLTNPANTFSDAEKNGQGLQIAANDVRVGLTTFGAMDEAYPSVASSSGYSARFLISGTNVTLRNLNTQNQICGKTMILGYSPLILDAGTYGGITYTNWISGSYGSKSSVSRMHHLILDGDHTEPCIFSPVIRCWSMDCDPPTNCTLYITKRGTGTYRFKGVTSHRAGTSDWRGALAVENGLVTFDSIAEAGVNSSLGKASMLQEPYCDVYDAKHDVDYAVTLGGVGTKGTLAYCGTTAGKTTTRPIAIYSDGALVNDSAQPLEWKGVSPRSDSAQAKKTFRLGGTSTAANVFRDITGALSLVKEGTGTWHVSGDTSFTGDVTVTGGKLVVHGGAFTYYKWVAMQCWGVEIDPSTGTYRGKTDAYGLHLQEFALFDKDGVRVNTGLTQAADITSIGAGEAAFTDAGRGYTYSPEAAKDYVPKIFNDAIDASWWWMPQATVWTNVPASHLSLTIHLAENTSPIASYDLVTSATVNSSPSRWKLYGSYDGSQWELLDDQTAEEQTPPLNAEGTYLPNYWTGRDSAGNCVPYAAGSATTPHTTGYSVVQPADAFGNVQNVRVAAGAELAAEGTALISHLTIDATDGGDIKGFTFAATGVLDVINAGQIHVALTLPGNYGTCKGLQNIKNWTVRVNGRAVEADRIIIEDGRISIKSKGTLLYFR